MNIKTAGYFELRAFIKEEKAKSQKAAEFFGNYTQFSTEKLRNIVGKWIGKNTTKTNVEKVVSTTEEVNIDEVVNILVDAVEKLKKLPSYLKTKELRELHAKAMEIEAELHFAS